jgi:SAM-dependent methyltransferase
VTRDDDSGLAQRTTVMRGYDQLADVYADERESFEDHQVLQSLLADAPDGRILDAGCGAGDPVLERLARDRPVVGLDFSSEQVRLADDVAPGRVVRGDMTALPVADDSVAAVTAFYSLIHVPADQHADVYAEFARALQPGGVVLVTTGTEDWSGRNDDWLDGGAPMEWDILGPDASVAHLDAAGFEVYDRVGVVDDLGEDTSRTGDTLVDPDSERADKLFLFARLAD